MICSDCQQEMTQVEFRGIRIDECPGCKGRWFDRDELRKAKDHTDDDLRWLDFDPFVKETASYSVPGRETSCPRCFRKMSAHSYEKSGVVVDKCPECHGIWLHYGEFEKIIRYLENIVVSKTAPEYVKDSIKQFLEVVAGHEDVVSEVKDFLVVLKLLEIRIGVEHPQMAVVSKKIFEYFPFL